MIQGTAIILIPAQDYDRHSLSRHIRTYLGHGYPFRQYFYEPLTKIFSKVILFDYIESMTAKGIGACNQELIDLVRRERPKYVVWITLLHELLESTAQIIRREGVQLVGFFGDDWWRFDEFSRWWIPYLDFCVTVTEEVVPRYQALGARVIFPTPGWGLPFDFPSSNGQEHYPVSFVGHKKGDREVYIDQIKKAGVPVHTVGDGWGEYVSREEMYRIFRSSKINLNLSVPSSFQTHPALQGRVFDVCLAGGFLLTEYTGGIEKYFEPDKEIVCFQDAREMVEKIHFYLQHEDQRRAIAYAGWKRSTENYTHFHFMSKAFSQIEALQSREVPAIPRPGPAQMPLRYRKHPSHYWMHWGRAFYLENYPRHFWREAFLLSILYYPFNLRSWFYLVVGFSPRPLRPAWVAFGSGTRRIYRAVRTKLKEKAA